MNKEFFAALRLLEAEKGIPQEYMIEKIEAALVSAFKKEYGNNTNVRVNIDPVKEDVKVYQQKEVVEVVEDPAIQISLADAKAISKRHVLGGTVEFEVKTKNFRRLSAAAAKSVIIQGIREGEHRAMQEAYESKREEIITATVQKIDYESGNVLLDTGTGYATLLKNEQTPGPELPPVPFPMQDLVPPGRLSRGEQPQQPPPPPPPPGPLRPLAGLSRKGSLKIRLSRLFRTKSCNGGSGGGDGAGKRPSGELAASAASLTDMGGSAGRELDAGR